MENTAALLFRDHPGVYFLALGQKALGPMSLQDIYEKLKKGECSWLHFFWTPGNEDWARIYEINELRTLLPKKPSKKSLEKMKKSWDGSSTPSLKKPKVELSRLLVEDLWFMAFQGQQLGPFPTEEVLFILKKQAFDSPVHLWKKGWPQWRLAQEVDEFKKAFSPSERFVERRKTIRKPLIARLYVHNQKDLAVGLCRDISLGGLQILTDNIPGPVGSQVKIHLSQKPADQMPGFLAEGEIVRILEDGKGFSMRFVKLSKEARSAIEAYIQRKS